MLRKEKDYWKNLIRSADYQVGFLLLTPHPSTTLRAGKPKRLIP